MMEVGNYYETIKIHCHEMIKPHVIDSLYYLSRKMDYHGKTVSNEGGWQGDFDNNAEWFIPFKMEVLAKCRIIIEKFNPKFDVNTVEMHAWANINCFGDYNTVHTHVPSPIEKNIGVPLSLLSGVYYVQKPKDSGDLIIQDANSNMKRFYKYNFDHVIPANEGECVLFFPDTLHSVGVNRTYEDRISIAFNLFI